MRLVYNGHLITLRRRRARVFRALRRLCLKYHIKFESWDDGNEVTAEGKLDTREFEMILRWVYLHHGMGSIVRGTALFGLR